MEDKIRDWLNTQGYPLEMRVAQAFRHEGMEVRQSLYYDDPEEKKAREIDVVAEYVLGTQDGLFACSYAIECKLSSDKPWLLFTSGDPVDFLAFLSSNSIALSGLVKNEDALKFADYLDRHSSIFAHDKLSHSLTAAFTTGTDVPYRALLTAIKAASWLANKRFSTEKAFAVAIPLVIIDTRLFEVSFDEGAELKIKEVDSGTIRLQAEVGEMFSPWVKIVTAKAFDAFAHHAAVMAMDVMNHCIELVGTRNLSHKNLGDPFNH